MADTVNQEINVNINALVKRIQDVREFVALIRSLREQRGGPVLIDEKISRGARASTTEVNQLKQSIESLQKSIEGIDERRFSRLAAAASVIGTIYSAVTNVPAFVEGAKTLKDLTGKAPAIAGGLSSIATGARDLVQATRLKVGDGITKAKQVVSDLVSKLPGITTSGGAAAGTIGRIGVAGAGAAIGVGALAAVVGVLLAAVLAIVAAVAIFGFLFNLSKGAADAGSKIHDMSQELGVSAEILSTLELATETTSTTFEEAAQSISKFNKLIGEAADGSKDAAHNLTRLGIDPQEALKDNEAALAKVFKRIHELPTPYEKARAATIAFGKSGANMVPVIDSVGGSLEKAKDKAREFGRLLSEQASKDTDEFGDQIDEVGSRLTGLRDFLGRALIPEFLKLLRILAHEFPAAGGTFSKAVQAIAVVVRVLTEGLIAQIAVLKTLLDVLPAVAALVVSRNFIGAGSLFVDQFKKNLAEFRTIANTPAPDTGETGKSFPFGKPDSSSKKTPADVTASEFEMRRGEAQGTFDLEKDLLTRLTNIYQTAFDNRKIATEDYFRATEGFRRRELEAEIKFQKELRRLEDLKLLAKQQRIDDDPDSTEAQKDALHKIAQHEFFTGQKQITDQIKLLERALADLPAATEAAETAALETLDQQITAFLAKVDEANGRTAHAAADAIDKEFRELLERVTIEQGANSPLVQLIKEFIQVQKDRARVKQIDEQLQPLGQQFEIDRLEIETRISNEQITQKQGRRELIQLQRRYLEDQLLILKNELAATKEARLQLEIKLKIANVEKQLADLKEINETARSINDSLRGGLEDFFASIADGTKSIKEAFTNLGTFILQLFARLAAARLVESIFGSLFGDKDGQGGIGGILSGLFGGKKAAGDMMTARPGGQLIQVAEAGHDELVVTTDPRYASRTSSLLGAFIRRTGILPDLERFASGGFARSLGNSLTASIPRLNAGAFVQAPIPNVAGGASHLSMTETHNHVWDPRHLHTEMQSSAGQRTWWHNFQNHKTIIKRELGLK